MMHSGVFADGPKGLVGLRRRKGVAEHFGVGRTKARRTSEIKDNMNGNEEMEPKRSVSYSIVCKHVKESEALGN